MTDLTTTTTTLALMVDRQLHAASLAKVAAAKDNLDKATVDLDKAIKAAHAKGASLRAIAEAASISHEKVRYIVK